MTHRLRRAVLAACLLALLTPTLVAALPWPAFEPAAERTAGPGFLDFVRSALTILFGENGSSLDPNGSTTTGDNGPGLDPDGASETSDNGPGLDPNGGPR